MKNISLVVNGRNVEKVVSDRMHLGDFLREQEGLTGTHLGCEHGVCGACTVLSDGQPIRSCITFAVACEGKSITTIEGYGDDPVMHHLRDAFSEYHALQCGYCTPGMLATARDIVLRLPQADEQRVRIELAGNLCRCTGYVGIVAAIQSVLKKLQDSPDPRIETLRRAVQAGQVFTPVVAPDDFVHFDAVNKHDVAEVSVTHPSAGALSAAQTPRAKNLTHIDGSFDVPVDVAEVWQLMTDLPAVAGCLPGAVIETQDGNHVKGRVSIKFGPMSASFVGSAFLEINEHTRTAMLKGSGQDSLSQSRASGDIQYRLESMAADLTRVHVDLDYSLQGPLAQFSRSGLVQEFVRRMITDFGKNVAARLKHPELTGHPAMSHINPVSILFGLIWSRIKRLFGAT